ncbi:negative regulation of gluconeogenesis protein [Niveomyces insectorum RCEF 264]|uniref:Negative regulation of gluconeogenesis protein n=1 Tax=Niveomyces insectorum RCEF 264 TaxID=1081102 RepID=A0A162MC82_9HYPO|nr:negative regulation of gluconeogenesis protein [Niveomyces insectorum RCEF 264]
MADHEAAKIDKANHLLLDQPLLRLPHELLRKNFRAARFVVEKESVAVKNALKDAATAGLDGRTTPDDVLKSLDAMVARMRGVKRKLAACADEEASLYRQVDARTAHLAELATMHTLDDVAYEAWSRRRLDRLLVDYLLRHGYGASAAALVEDDDREHDDDRGDDAPESRLRDLVDLDTFAHMAQIRQRLLRDHSVTEALAWCVENKKELRRMESNLEFMLRFQQYIELVRTQQIPRLADAINHARRHLSPLHHVYPVECHQAAALLCYPPDDAPREYAELWSTDRWAMLADLFTATHNQLLALPATPLLHLALSSGLSALKTPACHSQTPAGATLPPSLALSAATTTTTTPAGIAGTGAPPVPLHNGYRREGTNGTVTSKAGTGTVATDAPPAPANTQVGASVCPICSPELNELARHVPYAHHSKSHVEHDLLLLPNGRVYGKARLDEYARKAGLAPGTVRDLRTGDVFPADKLLKVYIT